MEGKWRGWQPGGGRKEDGESSKEETLVYYADSVVDKGNNRYTATLRIPVGGRKDFTGDAQWDHRARRHFIEETVDIDGKETKVRILFDKP